MKNETLNYFFQKLSIYIEIKYVIKYISKRNQLFLIL